MPTRAGLNRAVLAGAFVAAIVAAPAAFVTLPAAPPSSANYVADDCAAGESNDVFTDNCVPDVAPNVPGGAWPTVSDVAPPESSGDITESTPGDPDSIPEVDGVPCTGGRSSGACIGLEENAVPEVVPHSTLSSSP